MNKKIVFKILGIVGGLFIILSLFLPYVKSGSFSQSLWQIYLDNKQIYLAIVIIIFGLLPIILYAIDKKKEYTYMSVGALLFFVSSQLVNAISTDTFKTLNLGFYLMLVGTILITVITFISEKSSKVKVMDEQIAPISNNISNPLERNGLEGLPENEITNSPVVENPLQPTEVEEQPAIDDSMALGEEIPEYQPEDGVNPVLAEFSTEIAQPEANPTATQPETAPAQPAVEPAVQPEANPAVVQPEVPATPEAAPAQPVVEPAVQPEANPTATQPETAPVPDVQTPSIMPQPDINFDEPQQNEIPDTQEPQFDIFGQPK